MQYSYVCIEQIAQDQLNLFHMQLYIDISQWSYYLFLHEYIVYVQWIYLYVLMFIHIFCNYKFIILITA